LIGALASLVGLAVVAGVMAVNSADGTDYATWSWLATGIVWPLGLLASLLSLQSRRAGPAAMLTIGLVASFLFVWEVGQVGGVPLAMAGAAMLWQALAEPEPDAAD
jgi:hypothetical protein